MQSSNGNKFWEEMNKIKIKNDNITSFIDRKIGEKIAKVLKNKYETFYNEFL